MGVKLGLTSRGKLGMFENRLLKEYLEMDFIGSWRKLTFAGIQLIVI
jgi:hypothetical protein